MVNSRLLCQLSYAGITPKGLYCTQSSALLPVCQAGYRRIELRTVGFGDQLGSQTVPYNPRRGNVLFGASKRVDES